ncbi:hypothetical protein ACFYQ5_03950 [Streptomyces sp. NPDC005794]|uniref:hypothetical protein n=1 Tax=Streptomyces sp. NPDC005794 TaxID=3364733 RepID=UPI0036CA5C00
MRRAAGPYTPAVRSSVDAGEQSDPAVQASTVPVGWDGGWRRTAPPQLTLARTPMAVSDGLAFRAGLAAWRDPSFDTGLAHGLLASAPGGLMHEVTRPATSAPASHGGGGPLLLRALSPAGVEAVSGAAEGGSPTPVLPGARHEGTAPTGGPRSAAARFDGRGQDTTPSGAGSAAAPTPPWERPQVQRRTRNDDGPPDALVSGTGDSGSADRLVREQRETPLVQRRTRSENQSPGPAPSPAAPGGGRMANGPQNRTGTPSASGSSFTVSGRQPADRSDHTAPFAASARAQGQRGLAFEHTATVLDTTEPAARTAAVRRTGAPGGHAAPAPSPLRFPLVRRVAVVPDSHATVTPSGVAAPVDRRRATSPGRTAPPRSGTKATGAAAVQRESEPGPSGSAGPGTGRPSVRPRPVGRSLTVARRTAGPVRRVSVVRPAAPTADARSGSAGAPAATPAKSVQSGTGTPARRAPGRPPLGAPLPGPLPPTATESHPRGAATGRASGPVLPVVQRQSEESTDRREVRSEGGGHSAPAAPPVSGPSAGTSRAGSAHRSAPQQSGPRRTGLGPPLSALPPSADLLPGSRTARASGPDSRTAVQRAPAGVPPAPAAPGSAGVPHPEAPSTGRPRQAPLLGPPPEPDAGKADGAPSAGATSTPGSSGVPDALVQRRTAHGTEQPGRSPAPQGTGVGDPGGATRHDRPVHMVVARAVADPEAGAGPVPQAAPPARPTVRLLAARPLTTSTGTGRADAIVPPASPTRSRPVVAARWPREAVSADSGGAPAGGSRPPYGVPPVPGVQRTPAAATPPRVVRPAPAARPRVVPVARPDGSAPARPLPVTAPQSHLPTVQPSVAAPSKPADALRAAPSSPAPPIVQRDPGPPAGGEHTGGAATTASPAQGLKSAPQGARHTGSHDEAAQIAGADLDDLARRLLDPVARLLRTELRRGRERTGRPFDGRR